MYPMKKRIDGHDDENQYHLKYTLGKKHPRDSKNYQWLFLFVPFFR